VLATGLQTAREAMRERWPDGGERRRAIGAALAAGGPLDPLDPRASVETWLAGNGDRFSALQHFAVAADPDDLTLRQARALALADRIYHAADVPPAILDRARADALRIAGTPPSDLPSGNHVWLEMRR
jgi:uroporphyrin-III C-methyltransferase/precorrin-2 dehydrogenase/sirohydrochlorin ferrochelatase